MIYVFIDEFTPCLRDSITLELVQTEAVAVVRKSFLSKFNPENHWYVKWDEFMKFMPWYLKAPQVSKG